MQTGAVKKFLLRAAVSLVIVIRLMMAGAAAQDQPVDSRREGDPVKRARERIQAAVDEHIESAERTLAAAKLVNESGEAKKEGKQREAAELLERAEKIAAATDAFERSALIEVLLRRIADERAVLNPLTVEMAAPISNWSLSSVVPKSVLARYYEYREPLGRILVEEKLPVELLAVAIVESGFNRFALSPKGARGIWQLMPATAGAYGLPVRADDDHRTHPEHSTRAAAQYLRDLYQQFGDWKLAIAAYNAGEARVQGIIDRTGIRDFDAMARRGLLPLETRQYVPAVFALWSRIGSQNPDIRMEKGTENRKDQKPSNVIFAETAIRQ